MKPFYLYKIVNKINEKVYIGITSRPEVRFKEHLSKGSTCTKLRNAIQKYGRENFVFEILCIGSEQYILDLEEKAIIAYDSIDNGYNLVLGNPKTGAVLLSEEMKNKISAGLNKFHSENVAWNRGIEIGLRKPYDPHYVAGFWFPHLEVAANILNVTTTSLRRKKRLGILGETQLLRKDSVIGQPVYVFGFWFEDILQASIKLKKTQASLERRIVLNSLEQKQKKKGIVGAENHMTGRTGFLHHNSKAVLIEGVVYGSISEASRLTKYTKKMLYKRLKENVPGFSWYIENTEEILNGK